MKKHPLNIVIVILFVVIVILAFLLFFPKEENSAKKGKKQQDVVQKKDKQQEVEEKETLFVDTSLANGEEEVVSYIDEVSTSIDEVESQTKSSRLSKKTLENTFITLTDFIFYGGTIKGYTFSELSDNGKQKVLSLYEELDQKVEKKFPGYKEEISSSATRSYTTVVSKAGQLKESIVSKYKEQVGEEAYSNVVDNFSSDKERFYDAYHPYVEKGKEIGSQAIDKGKEVAGNAADRLEQWYQNYKESRE